VITAIISALGVSPSGGKPFGLAEDVQAIIALTADAREGTRERCMKAGMDDYIVKPVRLDDLRQTLQKGAGSFVGLAERGSRTAFAIRLRAVLRKCQGVACNEGVPLLWIECAHPRDGLLALPQEDPPRHVHARGPLGGCLGADWRVVAVCFYAWLRLAQYGRNTNQHQLRCSLDY
jgi:hypothetical protein